MQLKLKGRGHRAGRGNGTGAGAAAQSYHHQTAAVSETLGFSPLSQTAANGTVYAKENGPVASVPASATTSRPATGGGRGLPGGSLNYFGGRMGADFSSVRVHNDANADAQARGIGARAFTFGNHIYFRSGAYRPDTRDGQHLLAHELAHTLQQPGSQSLGNQNLGNQRPASKSPGNTIHRLCDPAVLNVRTAPVFFPHDSTLISVYQGVTTMSKSPVKTDAVGLVQQALVDLGFDLGNWGPRKDGVDRWFGSDTAAGVSAFQASEGIAASGIVDKDTLRCLDEIRSKQTVPKRQQGTVPPTEFQVTGVEQGGRDEDLFFERGSALPTIESILKIFRLTKAHRGCQLTLEGYISEDEKNEFGGGLASDRIKAVERWFKVLGHQKPGVCNPADSPARVAKPLPDVSAGVSSYRKRRKVEVVPKNKSSTTAPCPPGAVQTQPLDPATEAPLLTKALNNARNFTDAAIAKLVSGNVDGDNALKAYFGSTSLRKKVRANLTTWRNHVDGTMRSRNQKGTDCLSTCRTAIAFNSGRGSSAMMTLCNRFLLASFGVPQELSSKADKQAFVVLHEAGHGSIGTKDFGYGHRRLVEFLKQSPGLALRNTDSYTRLVFCLSGHNAFCAPRQPKDNIDTSQIKTGADQEEVRRGLAWLESWLQWVGQDVSGAYKTLEKSRRTGAWSNTHYQNRVFIPFSKVFELHRPNASSLPTMAEQTYMAAVLDRYLLMRRAASEGVEVKLDPVMRWESGSPGPKKKLFVDSTYLKLTSDRKRVERLLPLIIAATGSIGSGMRGKYEKFTKQDTRSNWGNHP